jgi:hypothetical protein
MLNRAASRPALLLPQVPAVTAEPRVKFLRGFPRIGGYVAAAVPAGPAGPASGSYHAVLAADSLLPDGHGQALTQQEVTAAGAGLARYYASVHVVSCWLVM